MRGFLTAVPEPGTWMLMLAGFGVIGGTLRRQRKLAVA
ncbi:MAG: PEPxxWA-CTERM sorting domain-containing protein [Sphingomicrobium sp.]